MNTDYKICLQLNLHLEFIRKFRHDLSCSTRALCLEPFRKKGEFLYDTIDSYIKDAQDSNRQYLVDTWKRIKADRLNHVNLLKDALEKEIHGG